MTKGINPYEADVYDIPKEQAASAGEVYFDPSAFNGIFLPTDDTFQKIFDKLDDLVISSGNLPDGVATGDIIRWNVGLDAWEAKSEPFSFAGLILTPALASLIDAEGAIYYNSGNKAVMVCTGL